MERQEGYYWVKQTKYYEPEIAKYILDSCVDGLYYCYQLDTGETVDIHDLFWIDLPENRLTPPNI